jgi:glycosyltransferase involved in cell wall biosynthesis
MTKVLYFYPRYSSFVASDHELLNEQFEVMPFAFIPAQKIFTPIVLIRQFFFLLIHLRSGVRMVSQFSGYHSLLPSLFSKLSGCAHYIILHGTECNNFPEYAYGYASRPLLFWCSKASLSMATRLLPVSDSLVFQHYTFTNVKYTEQGLRAFYPGLDTPFTVIHNGVDPERFPLEISAERIKNSFVTIATGLEDNNRSKLKGLDFICEVAQVCPDFRFTFVGGKLPHGLVLPPNITLIGHVENDQLYHLLNQHQFYIQWSVSEGFGISVVEAMMCGCIPVVSRVGILPEIAGPQSHILDKKDIHMASALLNSATQAYDSKKKSEVRDWAVNHFSLSLRATSLCNTIQSGR